MPQGVERGAEVDLSDRLYDGREDAGHLTGGLGQLVDGHKGQDIFRLDLAGHGKGKITQTTATSSDNIYIYIGISWGCVYVYSGVISKLGIWDSVFLLVLLRAILLHRERLCLFQ